MEIHQLIDVVKDNFEMKVREADLQIWLDQGYKLKNQVETAEQEPPKEPIALEDATVPMLKAKAEEFGISDFGQMKRATLIVAISERGVTHL